MFCQADLIIYTDLSVFCRGLSDDTKKSPFRKWYGYLGEIRSLIPKACGIIILTATATKNTKKQILDTLHLLPDEVAMVEQSPSRPNLCYVKQYLDKNEPLEKQFASLINDLKTLGNRMHRTLIYCQTRKQCSLLFRLFEVYLGEQMYHQDKLPQNRIVDMYHAGTVASVKTHISDQMARHDGTIRVLICTNAFGMGVNCKGVRNVIHFGPSKTVESYMQECGRAGRDEKPSLCNLLYNGLLSVHCDNNMKQYLQLEECSRQWLLSHFGCNVDTSQFTFMHQCCGFCMQECKCGDQNCKEFWSPMQDDDECLPQLNLGLSSAARPISERTVTQSDKRHLRKKLLEHQKKIFEKEKVETMVSCPTILMEFNMFHINQVVENCHRLFSLNDVLDCVEIWRQKYAVLILQTLKDVFNDEEIEVPIEESTSDCDETVLSDWNMIRNDSTLTWSVANV